MINDDHLTQIVEDICASLFEGADDALLRSAPADEPDRHLTAVVDITGDWNGSVSVSCRRATARLIASVMFAAPGAELSGSDIVDALGELANMAGGAVKGMLDGDKGLGLPVVAEGRDLVTVVPRSTTVAEIDHHVGTDDDVVHLAVHQAA